MSQKDKLKWDKKFKSMPELLKPRPPSDMLTKYANLAKPKIALDLACGTGRHTIYLSNEGFRVDSVDISTVALDKLREISVKNLNLIETDLDDFTPKKNHYGLVVMTNFLDRELIDRSKDALISGGLFIVETYMDHQDNEKKNSNPNFLLKSKELLDIFSDFEIIDYQEFENESYEKYRMRKSAIVAKKR